MLVILLRHATAEGHGLKPDAERALVDKGWLQVERVAAVARRLNLAPELILTSPLLRARETAQGVATRAGWSKPVIAPWLGLGIDVEAALAELDALRQCESVCLVGHEPDFSGLAGLLLGAPASRLHVRKASLVGISCVRPRQGGGCLEFFVPNRFLRGEEGSAAEVRG